ncbi:maleylpyruvate isomerase family mycothiol-dependent enzyme [Nocardia sp. CDC160]|uniref:maleylpyruvate isomerase family mycothiol-dependent enzyme n=1 Tax=Nocardia sp. CDC160 TaxID=3112166 RepID=UPI002DB953FE|nr:maleylpyruvate isomerase family mycothiol-dependent enzyme [Nocardia sp. CDC160]MEC3915939.1 maleylpyruvate isomerase family mycothiol-dependent enzyme [Nocardia sp. CDC160]
MPTTESMTTDQIWQAVATERATLADLLCSLSESDWDHQSLCESWRIRDVVAHVILSANPALGSILFGLLRSRGNLHAMIRDTAIRHAAKTPPAQLLTELRATTHLRSTALGTTPADRLMDLLVHGQDIAIPLGITREIPILAARLALDRIRTAGTFDIRTTLSTHRLTATDTPWTAGTGRPVEAPIAALLLFVTGRV